VSIPVDCDGSPFSLRERRRKFTVFWSAVEAMKTLALIPRILLAGTLPPDNTPRAALIEGILT
jgi:hypothetical protein